MAVAPFRPVKLAFGPVRPGSPFAAQLRSLENEFKRWTLHMSAQSGEVLRQALRPTFEKSQRYCPYLTGALRKSGYLEVRRQGVFRGYVAELGYGRGGIPPYAIIVHEVPVYHRPPERWKWLQAAITEDAAQIRQLLVTGVRSASGS